MLGHEKLLGHKRVDRLVRAANPIPKSRWMQERLYLINERLLLSGLEVCPTSFRGRLIRGLSKNHFAPLARKRGSAAAPCRKGGVPSGAAPAGDASLCLSVTRLVFLS